MNAAFVMRDAFCEIGAVWGNLFVLATRQPTAQRRSRQERRMSIQDAKARQSDLLEVHTDLSASATRDISGALNILLADMFVQYLKTKNFHWHCQVRTFAAFIALERVEFFRPQYVMPPM
jgi:hypothetical protein